MKQGRKRKWLRIDVELIGEHETYINGMRAEKILELDLLEILAKHNILKRGGDTIDY